jgi:two-component system response regulator QseB
VRPGPHAGGADAALACADFDSLLLDLGLPDGDGRAWLERRRAGGFALPVLVLTARGALDDRIGGLDAGADDYLVKPAEPAEIAARLRALLRRPGPRANPVIEVGPLRFDTGARQASVSGDRVDLTRREADLLEVLMRGAGSVVRRSQIENALYNFDEPVSPNAVDAAARACAAGWRTKGWAPCSTPSAGWATCSKIASREGRLHPPAPVGGAGVHLRLCGGHARLRAVLGI